MAFSRTLRASGCSTCRTAVLRTFVDFRSPQHQLSTLKTSTPYIATQRKQLHDSRRFLTDEVKKADDLVDTSSIDAAKALDAAHNEQSVESQEDFTPEEIADHLEEESSGIPWYLQDQASQQTTTPILDRQKLPDLPSDPPDILQPLLENLSIEHGIDDLKIIDLRKFDPPPALGANLLMIVGTARSEKHLHVSADRLCRWLRTTYRLRPHADGLLGRNEIKIKLRRKARRAKLLGQDTSDPNFEDGLRSGWICVNVGAFKAPESADKPQAPVPGFVGFGPESEDVKIVAQLFTESKRAEVDLERLWGDALKRMEKRNSSTTFESQEPQDFESEFQNSTPSRSTNSLPGSKRSFSTLTRPSRVLSALGISNVPRRGFSTSVWHQAQATSTSTATAHPSPANASTSVNAELAKKLKQLVRAGEYEEALSIVQQQPIQGLSSLQTTLLNSMCSRLEASSRKDAAKELGEGDSDKTSTPFLQTFYTALGRLPSAASLSQLLRLRCFAREIGHEGYSVESVWYAFTDLIQSGARLSPTMHLATLKAIRAPSAADPKGLEACRGYARRIFHMMHDQGLDILTEEVFLAQMEVFARFPPPEDTELAPSPAQPNTLFPQGETYGLPRLALKHPEIYRLNYLMKVMGIKLTSDASRIRYMTACAMQKNWIPFWTAFNAPAKECTPRSSELYNTMFRLVAKTGNQTACMKVLRNWVPELQRESIPVPLKDVKESIKKCLLVADPYCIEMADKFPDKRGEWVDLWRNINTVPRRSSV